jgi:hypothetical protein
MALKNPAVALNNFGTLLVISFDETSDVIKAVAGTGIRDVTLSK